MNSRFKKIIEESGMSIPEISKRTGVSAEKLKGPIYKKTRINQEHIEIVLELWPQFIYWLVTGETLEECGQISPEIEEIRRAKRLLAKASKK